MIATYLRNLPWLKAPIDVQRLNLLYGGSTGSALVGFIEAFILSSLFWQDIAGGMVAAWLTLFLCVRLGRVALSKAYWRARPQTPADLALWGRLVVVSAGVQALAWSLGAFVLQAPDNLVAEWALHLGLAAVAHASAVRLAHHGPGVLVYVIGIFVPLLVRDLWVGLPSHWLLAGVTVLIGVYVLSSGIRQTLAILDAVHQRQRNAELIEELKAENTARLEAQQQAEAAHAAKARFLAAISHDLRQPLHAMGLLAHSLHAHPRAEGVTDLSAGLVDCAAHMTELVDALVDQSRLEANALQPALHSFALGPLLQEVHRTQQPQALARGLSLTVDDTAAWAHSDRKLLSRVLVNLVSNAVRYTDQGSVRVRAEAGDDQRVHIAVQDTGRGISASDLPHIFDAYYQCAGARPDTLQGLGLGLTNVQRMGELLDLRLTVQSTLGQGSVFSFSLPLGQPTDMAASTDTAAPDALLNGQQVWVVDDDAQACHVLQLLLSAWGCRVTTAANAADALALLGSVAASALPGPDALIVDLHLGDGMNGMALVHALRQQLATPPAALLITADPAHPLAQQAMATMAVQGKPVAPMRLRAFLSSVQSG